MQEISILTPKYSTRIWFSCKELFINKFNGIENIDFNTGISLNDFIKKYEPDIIFLAQFSLIIKSDLIKNYTKKIVNLHHSPLPKYRGVSPITHAILNNETEFASTLHFVDEQVDTGEIISQRFFSIIDKTNEDVYSECIKKDDELIENFYKDIFYNMV